MNKQLAGLKFRSRFFSAIKEAIMTNSEKANIILQEIEYYLQFDTLQREYAEKGIFKALSKIERIEKNEL